MKKLCTLFMLLSTLYSFGGKRPSENSKNIQKKQQTILSILTKELGAGNIDKTLFYLNKNKFYPERICTLKEIQDNWPAKLAILKHNFYKTLLKNNDYNFAIIIDMQKQN